MDRALIVAHREKARVHAEAADAHATTGNLAGWDSVMRFYSALHVVQSYLAIKGRGITAGGHIERERAMDSVPELSRPKANALRNAYLHLRAVSEQVRYDPRFEFRRVHAESAADDLRRVKSFLDSKIERALEGAK